MAERDRQGIEKKGEHNPELKLRTELIEPHDPRVAICKNIENVVFYERFGNTPEQMEEEYSPYEPFSYFILEYDEVTQEPIGTIRFIINSESVGLKTLRDIAVDPPVGWGADVEKCLSLAGINTPSATVDHATTAVLRQYRRDQTESPIVHLALQASFFKEATEMGVEHFVAIFDDRPWASLLGIGMDIRRLPGLESRPYLGSESSTPVYGNLPAMLEHAKVVNPWLYDLVVNNKWHRQ